jgi:uncharacterized membrane protein
MTTLSVIGVLADSENWSMHGSGWWAPMMIGMVLFWGAVILGFVWLVRGGFDHRQQRPDETALSVLDRRFAEGAVSLDEYHRRRDVLVGAAVPRPGQGVSSHRSERS